MAWTVAKHTSTPDGIAFEFHGDKVDQQGRPLQIACAFVPSEEPEIPVTRDPDPAVLNAAMQEAVAQVMASVGDGTIVPVKPSLLSRLLGRA